ncbi:MAG: YbhB/YbcL family Raf kinase inhibitor-like protein [Bacteriovoracaceae bacterium]|nr:YbhB/YbcL family Raf kinase inhibitor-like protein [Bacteriovoracaceae bacterium]
METLFTLKTSSFDPSKTLPNKFVFNSSGCTGDNVSPELEWTGAPETTKSFAITVFDPDAPTGSGWWHWTVANIPANVTNIEEGASNNKKLPAGAIEGKTDYGTSGYGGACPPPGKKAHRYIFTVYALKTDKIDIDKNTSGKDLDNQINANTIAKASFTVKYGRS